MQPSTDRNSWIMGDGHVHIHDTFDCGKLFFAALNNFKQYAQSLHLTGTTYSFLLLTESAGTEAFIRLRDTANNGFTVQPTGDSNCLRVVLHSGEALFVVAGRQIVTADSLEVLALGLDAPYPDGRPIHEILQELKDRNCLLVLPWGAGKWLGKRGGIIEETVQTFNTSAFFLGDNGNRPFFWPQPAVFSRAIHLGTGNLQGSDPLPFPDQEVRAGSFGFYLPGTVRSEHPFQSLLQQLTVPENSLRSFGKPERALPFFHLQISMQLNKYFNR
ncbi:MAG: hypothetical protein D3924_03950 [Candidatus Electrothrix sp. AR4]|nr:hypothetical protein [Candidatus Electrothrix sp. AR4]